MNNETDALYPDAVNIVRGSNKASISRLQRALKIGYNRASRMTEAMEKDGIVALQVGGGYRVVDVTPVIDTLWQKLAEREIPSAVEITEQTMLGELMKLCTDEMKAMPDVWQKLAEREQQNVIERLQMRCEDAIKQAVNIIASNDRPVIKATVDQVVFKDGVKATFKMTKFNTGVHDLADAEGSTVLIVVGAEEAYLGGADAAWPRPSSTRPRSKWTISR